jgi:hypothetical protein
MARTWLLVMKKVRWVGGHGIPVIAKNAMSGMPAGLCNYWGGANTKPIFPVVEYSPIIWPKSLTPVA